MFKTFLPSYFMAIPLPSAPLPSLRLSRAWTTEVGHLRRAHLPHIPRQEICQHRHIRSLLMLHIINWSAETLVWKAQITLRGGGTTNRHNCRFLFKITGLHCPGKSFPFHWKALTPTHWPVSCHCTHFGREDKNKAFRYFLKLFRNTCGLQNLTVAISESEWSVGQEPLHLAQEETSLYHL